jgi:hypothetical protein
VAVGSDQVRGYLAELGTPAEEIARLIAEARQAGAVTFACPLVPGRPAVQLTLSFAGEACQLTIGDAVAGAWRPQSSVACYFAGAVRGVLPLPGLPAPAGCPAEGPGEKEGSGFLGRDRFGGLRRQARSLHRRLGRRWAGM